MDDSKYLLKKVDYKEQFALEKVK